MQRSVFIFSLVFDCGKKEVELIFRIGGKVDVRYD